MGRLTETGTSPSGVSAADREVPGTVVLTFSAIGRDGHGTADGQPARLRVSGPLQPLPPLIDVPLDGTTHAVGQPVFAGCRPGQSCTADFFFELFAPVDGDDALPVTLTFRLEARLASLAADPFPGHAAISIGPAP